MMKPDLGREENLLQLISVVADKYIQYKPAGRVLGYPNPTRAG
jgi:hypothetical protein